jgi:hypothetical protein
MGCGCFVFVEWMVSGTLSWSPFLTEMQNRENAHLYVKNITYTTSLQQIPSDESETKAFGSKRRASHKIDSNKIC